MEGGGTGNKKVAEMAYETSGSDSDGKQYTTLHEMWDAELRETSETGVKRWYHKAVEYWKTQPATVDGVLGGYGSVSTDDLDESLSFLLPFFTAPQEQRMQRRKALDCGAGMGRIAKDLLTARLRFESVDLLEPCSHMLEEAKRSIPSPPLGLLIEGSIQTHPLPDDTYDLIVLQWVGIYLTDDDFVKFVADARRSLRPNGVLFVKENVSRGGFLVDKDDSSLTRSPEHMQHLIKAGGGEVVSTKFQVKFPRELFRVIMYAVR